jgi:hypothetical protein
MRLAMLQRSAALALPAFYAILVSSSPAAARPQATVKQQTIRAENPRADGEETLVLPYGFSSDSMGTVFGVGGGAKGFYQEQLLLAGTVFAGTDDAYGVVAGAWDYRPPFSERLFFTAVGSYGHYPRQRAYTVLSYDPDHPRRGSNDSGSDDYVETGGENNWLDLKVEYVLPLGAGRSGGMATYRLRGGLLEQGATGGGSWNPLAGGITTVVIRQFNQLESFETEYGDYERPVHPVEFGIGYNNTDYPVNPSTGSNQYLALTRDFGWGDALTSWTFLEFEASKYLSFGQSDWAKQRVLALNFWTGDAPTWEERLDGEGRLELSGNPPQFEGATLGGFYRMRGYPSRRFNDRSVIYSTAEYRYTPFWNPLGQMSWLRWLKMDWWQFVGFVEGGRVADAYTLDALFTDWKADAGMGVRALMAGGVVRLDMAASDEGSAMWVMFGHPF